MFPPKDGPVTVTRLISTSHRLYMTVIIAVVVAGSCAIAALIFNYENQTRKYMEQSQPQCNGVIIGGCALGLLSIILWGLPTDQLDVPDHRWTLLCHVIIDYRIATFSRASH